uniref:U1-type domain-containing protein n=1 Tax=Oncorhynchus mykiss TaxID=8022 RepID=A0A8C7TD03_ONCMY
TCRRGRLRGPSRQKNKKAQYPNDYYESGNKFCQHIIDWTRKNMYDDHLKSKAHVKNKEKHHVIQSMPLQTTITSARFIQDFVAVCAESDIPLGKLRKLRTFLVKHCKQGGAVPGNKSSLRQTHLPGKNENGKK